ncbi:DMT family transporter [Pectobacterium aroidearum]|uniref:DMT family transporter n=1 Tax=Pectobacterium aroidearum TaxID=1201031 RepID=UPI0032EE24A4
MSVFQSKEKPSSSSPHFSSAAVFFMFVIPPLLWAGNFIVGRAIRNDVPPVTLTLVRWIVALAIILPFALPHIRRDLPLYYRHAGRIIAVSLSGVAAFSLLVYVGLHHTSGTNALLLNSCVPVLIMLFSALFFGGRLTGRQCAGLLVSCCGVLAIIFKGDPGGFLQLVFSSGDLLLLAAMSCFAFYTLWLRKMPPEINRMGLLGMQVIITVTAVFPLWIWEQGVSASVHWSLPVVTAVIFLGLFPSFISYLLYGRCVEAIGAARAGLSIHLIPVFGVAISALFLNEPVHLYHLIGIGMILAGVSLASTNRKVKLS